MRRLPDSLDRWAEPLSGLGHDLGTLLLPWVRRIDGALGPPGRGRADESGDPDGYDGVASRGPYHRLLASQWLLADLHPDEFLRRAAMGEHLFYRLARQTPQVDEAVVALLDAGPDQLGAPRLAQLAALVVLARRAQDRRVRLLWGHLQDPEPSLHDGLGRPQVERLLSGRTPRRVRAADGERWRAWLDEQGLGGDLWLLGAPRLAQRPTTRGFAQLGFDTPRFAETDRVEVTTREAGSSLWHRGPHLPLPDPGQATRLLRDPFGESRVDTTSAPALDPEGGLQLTGDGNWVTARLVEGGVVSYPVPNSPNATPGKPRFFVPADGHRVLAATRMGRRLMAVTLRGRHMTFYGVGDDKAVSGHDHFRQLVGHDLLASLALDDSTPSPLCRLETFTNTQGAGMVMHAPNGRLLTLMPKKGNEFRIRAGGHALALARFRDRRQGCRLVEHLAPGELRLRTRSGTLLATVAIPPRTAPAEMEAHIGLDTWAAHRGEGEFSVLGTSPAGVETRLHLPSNHPLVGVFRGGLVVLTPDRREIALLQRQSSRTLLRAGAPIVTAEVASDAPRIACLDERGGLLAVSTDYGGPVLQVEPSSDTKVSR